MAIAPEHTPWQHLHSALRWRISHAAGAAGESQLLPQQGPAGQQLHSNSSSVAGLGATAGDARLQEWHTKRCNNATEQARARAYDI